MFERAEVEKKVNKWVDRRGIRTIMEFIAEYYKNTDSIKFRDGCTPAKENDIIQPAMWDN